MERFIFDHPDLRRAAAIISGAKIEAKKIIPGEDEKSLNRRYALTSAIIEQVIERHNLNGEPSSNQEVSRSEEAAA